MHKEIINGIPVEIPLKPYPSQIETMEIMFACWRDNKSGMIESPTGTGKSFSILCAVVAQIRENKKNNKVQRFFITSRTHKQIDQLVKQFKQLPNHPRMTILSSKRLCCINNNVQKVIDIDTECRKERDKMESCMYYRKRKEGETTSIYGPFSIEELKSYGRTKKVCPYYAALDMEKESEIIFCPYNYIASENIRRALDIDIEDANIIIDEGHNIEDTCREIGSMTVDINECKSIIKQLVAISGSLEIVNSKEENDDNVAKMKKEIDNVKKVLDKMIEYIEEHDKQIEKKNTKEHMLNKNPLSYDIEFEYPNLTSILEKFGVTNENFSKLLDSITYITQSEFVEKNYALKRFIQGLKFVIEQALFLNPKDYCIIVSQEKIVFSCLNAKIIFDPISNISNTVILLSGTLTPFKFVINELMGVNSNFFSYTKQISHVIDREQMFSACIANFKGKEILGTYKGINENSSYFMNIAHIIMEIVGNLQRVGGVLVFLPNYGMIEKISKHIKNIRIFQDSNNSKKFENEFMSYKAASKHGLCVFLCVFRGKASEGVDFRDHESRAVVIIGLPYPNMMDKKVICKKNYNNKYLEKTGSFWYDCQMYKAVNQAIGRCIRHRKDWGSLFLLDIRYKQCRMINSLSPWAMKFLKKTDSFEMIENDFKDFIAANNNAATSGIQVAVEETKRKENTSQGNSLVFQSVKRQKKDI